MIDVGVHEIGWCPCNGHPVLYLRVGDTGHGFGVAISPGDAQAMAARPVDEGAERARVYALLETTIVGLGARLAAVALGLGPDRVMRAWLTLERPGGPLTLPAALPDGIVLARRARVPLRMAEADLERLAGLARPGSNPGSARGSAPDGAPTPPAPFRDLIESLDLDGLGAESSPADDPC
jgi:bifunctional DNase/RNase